MMHIADQAQHLLRQGRAAEAVDLLANAAKSGDGAAALMLARWKLFGEAAERDLKGAHQLLRKAAQSGSGEAAILRASLTANGTGCPAAPGEAQSMLRKVASKEPYAALQLAFLPKMRTIAEARAFPRDYLSKDPEIYAIRKLLLPEECRYICSIAEPSLRPSVVVDPATGRRMPHPVRTSDGMSFGPAEEDLVINMINRRIAAVTGTFPGWGEPLHILRYAPGQEYKVHHDAIPGLANQRQITALVYLNTDYKGGETIFPDLELSFRGEPGDALVFANTGRNGEADPRAQHAGRPVTAGIKWLATRWIRQGPYHPWAQA